MKRADCPTASPWQVADPVVLENGVLRLFVDPAFGGEIRSLQDVGTGTQLLMQTPWQEAALQHRRTGFSFDSEQSMLEWWARYGGGMQAMFPHAGIAEPDNGFNHPFHGEACVQRWNIVDRSPHTICMTTNLLTAPLQAQRTIRLDGEHIFIRDHLKNKSTRPVLYMFLYHPAFGRPFLDPTCTIATSARKFTYDPVFLAECSALGSPLEWPFARTANAGRMRLDRPPEYGTGEFTFGWLSEFGAEPWYEICNPGLGIGLRISWSSGLLSHAWMLRDSAGSQGYPWHGDSYTFAIEPATCASGGDERKKRTLMPGETADLDFNLEILRDRRSGQSWERQNG